MTNHTAEKIDPARKSVAVRSGNGAQSEIHYDKLLIGTGARPSSRLLRVSIYPASFLFTQ